MVDSAQPKSLSAFRGLSRTGDGEGPGKPVPHGEQYLAVDPDLYETDILDAIRPWMTLDSDPADHDRLNDRLEGWSLFQTNDYLWVVRLVSSGSYDRRAAYFAHGRAWKRDGLTAGFDPGLNLGLSDAFAQPPRNNTTEIRVPAEGEPAVRSSRIGTEPETAARFLGHLFQAMASNYAVIVAAPIGDFTNDGALSALVSFSGAALPEAMRRDCRIRVYSRFPDLFLRHLGVNLLVVPEDAARTALASRPAATLLDRRGEKLNGRALDPAAYDYASAVVERTIAIPAGLTSFSERFRQSRSGLPSPGEVRAVQITYNLAFALSGPPERRDKILSEYLPHAAENLGPGLDWPRLIPLVDWSEFPREAIVDQLLAGTETISPAGLEFLRAVEHAASQLGVLVDERLPDWWAANDAGKVRRMVELLTHRPPLVSEAAAAERTSEIPLEGLKAAGPLAVVLRAELNQRLLARRAAEASELAGLARDQEIFRVLSEAVSQGGLDSDWARIYVRKASTDDLVQASRLWFEDSRFWTGWGNVPKLLLDRLREMDLPPAILGPAINSGFGLDPVENLEIYVRLADLSVRIDRVEGRSSENALTPALWKALPRMSGSHREYLEGILFDREWRYLRSTPIDLSTLLHLASGFRKDDSFERFYAELDDRMRQEPEATTEVLVRNGWWYFWRTQTVLDVTSAEDRQTLYRSACSWLTTKSWSAGVEATLESWEKAIEDLPRNLSGPEITRLRERAPGRVPWPWIPPFEEEQLDRLIERADDLDALAELAEALRSGPSPSFIDPPYDEYILSCSRYSEELPAAALEWLRERRSEKHPSLLTLQQSAVLWKHAGHRKSQALAARIYSIANIFDSDPEKAFGAADDPDLWANDRFLSEAAAWMDRKGSVANIGKVVMDLIDGSVRGEPSVRPSSPSRALVRELVKGGWNRAARLLQPDLQKEVQREILADNVLKALLAHKPNEACWHHLAESVKRSQTDTLPRHPLSVLAERIRVDPRLTAEQRRQLAHHGWSTFAKAAAHQPALLMESANQPAELPLFDLAATLQRAGGMGNAALQVAQAKRDSGATIDPQWWRTLLGAMRDFKRYGKARSADDREDAALALIFGYLDDVKEWEALSRAVKAEARQGLEWPILAEFGADRI